jgi:hypothetical protein
VLLSEVRDLSTSPNEAMNGGQLNTRAEITRLPEMLPGGWASTQVTGVYHPGSTQLPALSRLGTRACAQNPGNAVAGAAQAPHCPGSQQLHGPAESLGDSLSQPRNSLDEDHYRGVANPLRLICPDDLSASYWA